MKYTLITILMNCLFFSSTSMAQFTFSDQMIGENTKTGRLFTVTIKPKGKLIEVQVAGSDIAKVNLSQLSMAASFSAQGRQWSVQPEKDQASFVIKPPEDLRNNSDVNLKIKIEKSKAVEIFNFKLN